MFGRKKAKPQIDKEQLALIQNAQRRIKQKKRFYSHAIVFAIFSILLFTFNVVLGFKDEIKIADTLHWSVIIIIVWFVFLFLISFQGENTFFQDYNRQERHPLGRLLILFYHV